MSHITTITSLFSLQQLIHSPTHFSPSGSPSTIDLIFAPLSFQSVVTLLPPVGTFDHQLSHLFSRLLHLSIFTLDLPHPKKEYGSIIGLISIKSMTSSLPLTGPLSFLLTLMMPFLSFMSCSSISFINLRHLNLSRSVPSLHGSCVHCCTRFGIAVVSLHKLSHDTLLISGLHIACFVMKSLLLSNDPRQVTFSLCLHLLVNSGLM